MNLLLLLLAAVPTLAESGIDAWLRYAPLPQSSTQGHLNSFPRRIISLGETPNGPLSSAASELKRGINGFLNLDLDVQQNQTGCPLNSCGGGASIVLATLESLQSACGSQAVPEAKLEPDGYWLDAQGPSIRIIGQNERGVLYGSFAYLSIIAQGTFSKEAFASNPSSPIRMANQWDNLDAATAAHGSIERGYGGPSIFFDSGLIKDDLSRVSLYGRLMASIGINACVINNVNADPNLLNETNLQGLKEIADLFRPWGVQVGISLNFAAPQLLDQLDSFDPLDPCVIDWWDDITDRIYQLVPDLVGYLVKANSEGQPGPLTYNRTLADGANMFARAVEPYGGIVMFRAFVYNQLNESDWKADRANAAVEFFGNLDSQFADNVIVQIKNGPIDFQVREPSSPLFANIPKTAVAIELEVTQEYLGQQSHLVYLAPMWKTTLDFDMRYGGQESRVRDIVTGKVFNHSLGGFAGVLNVGSADTWLGSILAMSNMFAFGRLAWDPTADAQDILEEWISLTFGLDPCLRDAIVDMCMKSWPAYEQYSGNLGIQTLTDILYTHFGPNPASQDDNGFGQWTRADGEFIGMDRTVSNGSGNAGQYPEEVAAMYENLETTPDDLVLWFHHVSYDYKLRSGKTVIQTFYDNHYSGAATAQTFASTWSTLQGLVDDERFDQVMYQLSFQEGHAIVWRDAVSEFYRNLSGIPDDMNRVRNHSHRIEAEDMQLAGFAVVPVTPTECASKYQAIATNGTGTASTTLHVPDGEYNVAVNYFDVMDGRASYQLLINGEVIESWKGDAEDHLGHDFSAFLDCHSAIRITFKKVKLADGDVLSIVGTADGLEQAALDYISVLPQGVVD